MERLAGVQGEQGRHMPWHRCLRKSLEVLREDVENKKLGNHCERIQRE